MASVTKLSTTTIVLHWVVAFLMIFMTGLGLVMEDLANPWWFDLHTSLGIVVLIPILPRVVWRVIKGWPSAAGDYQPIEHTMSKIVHWVLILSTLAMPLSGMLMAVAGGHGLSFFDWHLVSEVPDPNNPEEVLILHAGLQAFGEEVHDIGATVLQVALALHVVGALKHHIMDGDMTLKRMLGKQS